MAQELMHSFSLISYVLNDVGLVNLSFNLQLLQCQVGGYFEIIRFMLQNSDTKDVSLIIIMVYLNIARSSICIK